MGETNADPFQFHKGTIKTKKLREYAVKDNGFNSIKVRLRLDLPETTCPTE